MNSRAQKQKNYSLDTYAHIYVNKWELVNKVLVEKQFLEREKKNRRKIKRFLFLDWNWAHVIERRTSNRERERY